MCLGEIAEAPKRYRERSYAIPCHLLDRFIYVVKPLDQRCHMTFGCHGQKETRSGMSFGRSLQVQILLAVLH